MEPRRLDGELRALAGRQHGLVTRGQLRAFGGTGADLAHRMTTGEWVAVSRRVLRQAGTPVVDRQRCMAAVLDAGREAALSLRSAAWLIGLPGFSAPIEIEVSRRRAAQGRRAPSLMSTSRVTCLRVTSPGWTASP